jgi:hypothetical protein
MNTKEKRKILMLLEKQNLLNNSDGATAMIVTDELGNTSVIKIKHMRSFVLVLFYKANKRHIFPYDFSLIKK